MEKGTTYMVRPRIAPRNRSVNVARISEGSTQLFVGPASSGSLEQTDRKSVVKGVTGVQTCALPILHGPAPHRPSEQVRQCRAHLGGVHPVVRRARIFRIARADRSEERREGSDWSSDVCSSDLTWSGPASPLGTGPSMSRASRRGPPSCS